MPKKIAVVGAGIGGLSVAARLAKSGFDVEVFEKLSGCGGRNNIIEDKGFKFDIGPSFVIMTDFFEEIFNYCGENIKDYLDLKELEPDCGIFTFDAMFMGGSFGAQKIFHPMGGMYKIPVALENLGRKFGAKYRYNCEVTEIKKKENGFILNFRDREVQADKVVINADYAYAQADIFKRNIPNYKYSCSAYLLYLGLKAKVPGVSHYNLFFSPDLKRNLNQVFKEKVFPDNPSFYVHVPTIIDPMLAPAGRDLFYILVPVANLKDNKDNITKNEEALKKIVFARINKKLGIDLEELIEVEHKFYPQDFISRYNIKYGAVFGRTYSLIQSMFFRPANFDRKLKGVYFVGASVGPTGGLPIVIASSKIVVDLINRGK
ncbi:MAG: FAD-dependent oxidoreductase [Candidatus Omnitrophota bacterium]